MFSVYWFFGILNVASLALIYIALLESSRQDDLTEKYEQDLGLSIAISKLRNVNV